VSVQTGNPLSAKQHWEYDGYQQCVPIVNNVRCTLDNIIRNMARGWRLLSPSTWHMLGITWDTISSFGLPLCKKDIEKVEMIQQRTRKEQRFCFA